VLSTRSSDTDYFAATLFWAVQDMYLPIVDLVSLMNWKSGDDRVGVQLGHVPLVHFVLNQRVKFIVAGTCTRLIILL
jgi:hypothetical protein